METDNIPEVNLDLITVKVEAEVRPLRTNRKVVMGTPIFGIHKECRKSLGINNIFQYWKWKRQMRKNWKNDR